MTGLTETLLNTFLILGILIYAREIISSVGFGTDKDDEDDR